jgi:TRAP-type C4-dicarboxylate transport system permease small subunit
MTSNWSYVVASYLVTWGALLGYVAYVRGRARAAADELARHADEETR